MNRFEQKLGASFFITVAIALIFVLSLYSCKDEVEQTKPDFGSITESVYASVTVQPKDFYDVYSQATGILETVYIEEGDSVSKGQIIALVSNTDPQLNIDNANLSLTLAKENYLGSGNALSVLASEIKASKNQLQLDSVNFYRQQILWNQNIGSKSEYESKKLKYELSQSNLNILQNRYTQTKNQLEQAYKSSQNALLQAKSKMSDYSIKSKIDGIVYDLMLEEGEMVNPQIPVAQIGKSNQFILEMLIDEIDIAAVKENQEVFVSLDAYKDSVFKARIDKIYPKKDSKNLTFKVEGMFVNAPEVLYAGLSGEANILISERSNAVTIPLEYLFDGNKVNTNKGEVVVETGIRDMSSIEIISGIDSSTVILKPNK